MRSRQGDVDEEIQFSQRLGQHAAEQDACAAPKPDRAPDAQREVALTAS